MRYGEICVEWLGVFFAYCKSKHWLLEIEEITNIHIKQSLNWLKSRSLGYIYINTILKNSRRFLMHMEEKNCICKIQHTPLQINWILMVKNKFRLSITLFLI